MTLINKVNQVISLDIITHQPPGPRFNIKTTSYQYRKSHCGDKMILWPSYLHNGISFTGKMSSLYWIRVQMTWTYQSIMVCEPHAAALGIIDIIWRWRELCSLRNYIVRGMATDDLAIQGSRASASMVLAQFWIIPGMAPEGLIDPCHAEYCGSMR